jgi:hypothetical protein
MVPMWVGYVSNHQALARTLAELPTPGHDKLMRALLEEVGITLSNSSSAGFGRLQILRSVGRPLTL